MSSSRWEQHVENLQRQVKDLQQTLDQTKSLSAEQRRTLSAGSGQLRNLLGTPEDFKGLIGELPKLLKTFFSNSGVGAVVIGPNGDWLLFNSLVRAIFGQAINGTALKIGEDGVQFFNADHQPVAVESLPWMRSLAGEDIHEQELIVGCAGQQGEVRLQITTTPLMDSGDRPGGAIVLMVDGTEMANVAQHVHQLTSKLSKQLELIESAEDTLRKLSVRLGVQECGPPPSKQGAERGKEASEPPRILIVDDMPVNQRLLLLQIKKMGCVADMANNGREAVDLVARNKYALVFMDCDMPVMDGYEATRTIRKAQEGTGQYTPIVAMTSLDRKSDRYLCLSAGMDEFLMKGVDEKPFQAVMEKYTSKAQTQSGGRIAELLDISAGAPDNTQDFSVEKLQKSFGGEELQDIITLFLGSSSTLVSCLDFAIEEKDVKGIGHFAYSLKGPASTMSMYKVARLCAEITAAAEHDDWETARNGHKVLKSELSAVQQKLESFVKQGLVSAI